MRKLLILLFISLFLSFTFTACKSNKHILTDNDIAQSLKDSNITCRIAEFPQPRSEHFHFKDALYVVSLLYIGEEEVFIFTYDDADIVKEILSEDYSEKEAGTIFYTENIILLYRGNDTDVLSILTKNFNMVKSIEDE
ncbi:MAG: hypothetical protein ACOYJX_04255 [Acutalibacteraceae bacterium]|jgi:hypothetical protein